jgi:DNA-directed RNA polymerase subunit RPC12/RpoP
MAQVSRHCSECGRKTLHVKEQLSNGMGCLLTVITVGLFLPFWLAYSMLVLPFRPYRCQVCGKGRLT